jgi:hypothetical protein
MSIDNFDLSSPTKFKSKKTFTSTRTFGENENIEMLECDTPLLKSKFKKKLTGEEK